MLIIVLQGVAKCQCGQGWAADANGDCQFLYSQGNIIKFINKLHLYIVGWIFGYFDPTNQNGRKYLAIHYIPI